MDTFKLKIVIIFTIGFVLASLLGFATQRLKLSPLLGYLFGGYLIGPFSPGYQADLEVAEQLAEIGVILMMFGVGLHFKWEELSTVKRIAIPGAVIQITVSTIVGAIIMQAIGWSWEASVVVGLAASVASTVVLVRCLADNDLLNTPQGHIAVGWLIVEDVLTVVALLLLPIFAELVHGEAFSFQELGKVLSLAGLKFFALGVVIFWWGRRIMTFILSNIARTRSHELFTITVLALTLAVATGSSLLFGTSIALGAFLAGMVIGRTDLRHQALANSLPLQDVFVVIFFLTIGMLFNPAVITDSPQLFLGILGVVLFVKPITSFFILIGKRYPLKTALTVAVALGQIGEFSFILAEESSRLHILPDEGYDLIVACALVSIALNPYAFNSIGFLNRLLEKKSPLPDPSKTLRPVWDDRPNAIVIGYGPVGQSVVRTLEKLGFATFIIDRNVDTVEMLNPDSTRAIYGDASQEEILRAAHIDTAKFLIITVPEVSVAISIVHAARSMRPRISILARSGYRSEQSDFKGLGVKIISSEEELIKAFSLAAFKMTDSYMRSYLHNLED